jgi:hypothetical protein
MSTKITKTTKNLKEFGFVSFVALVWWAVGPSMLYSSELWVTTSHVALYAICR